MKSYEKMDYHKTSKKLVDILCQKTQNSNQLFFHVLVAYYFTKVASMMRTVVKTHDRGKIPVNMYAINLAFSGEGKGHSTNIVEDQVIHVFKERFMEETFPKISEQNLANLALKRATKKNCDEAEELLRVTKEFELLGNLAFSFDSGTTAAVKQMRQKLLMSGCGSMNMEIDEIGSNLLGNVDVLNTFLELFDVGKVKQKLTKNTQENLRSEEIDGQTPSNMMLFGTPAKLLNGGRVEEELYAMLETGYARRCIFGYTKSSTRDTSLTPEQIYNMLTDNTSNTFLQVLAQDLGDLAHPAFFDTTINIDKDVSLLLIEYKLKCERISNGLSDHEEIRKAEISHRYFKALKLAGTYAFIDQSPDLTKDHLYNAIKLVEASGKAFETLLTRERNYVKLANYIANIGREVTHVDLVEDLPFYKGSGQQKQEMMNLAIAYGYKNNIIIKQHVTDGIEFLSGEALRETDLAKMRFSYSTQMAENYTPDERPFDKLHILTQAKGYHWASHQFIEDYRKEENAIPGFNMIVLDIDEGVSIDTAKLLLKDYTYHMYTTKRHTDSHNRFRIIMPLSHNLKLKSQDYKAFMDNIYEWLPFDVDKETGQRSRKWMSCEGNYCYNTGENVNALLFIPQTTKNEQRKKIIDSQQSFNNVERWFINNTRTGNRSNQLIRYGLMLVDSGLDVNAIQNNIIGLNNKLPDKMPEGEIHSTIMVTVSKAIHRRDSAS